MVEPKVTTDSWFLDYTSLQGSGLDINGQDRIIFLFVLFQSCFAIHVFGVQVQFGHVGEKRVCFFTEVTSNVEVIAENLGSLGSFLARLAHFLD